MKLLLALLLALPLAAQNPMTAVYPSAVADDEDLGVACNSARTTLAAAIDASTLTVTVASAATLCYPSYVTLGGSEVVKVCSITSNTLTVCSGGRGVHGGAAAHAIGASVNVYVDSNYLNQIAAEVKAIEALLGANGNYCASGASGGTTYACTIAGLASYRTGAMYAFKADAANSGSATINFTSLGAKTMKKSDGAGALEDLEANDISTGQIVSVRYDGTYMQVVSGAGGTGGSGITTATSTDGAVSVNIVGSNLDITAGTGTAMVDANNTFTGDNKYSELCTATSTGVTQYRWVQKKSTGCEVSSATTQPPFGLAASTVASASATIYRAGRATCSYSNTATAGNWATVSSGGQCTDSGTAATSAAPTGAVAVAEAAGTGNILVSIWPAPSASASSSSSPILIARTKTTTAGSGDTDIDSVNTTIDAGKCLRIQAHWENLTAGANANINLNLGATAFALSTGVTGAGSLFGMICNAASVQNSQVVYGSVGLGAWYGNAGTIKTTSSVDTSTSTKVSISADQSQEIRLNWLVEKLY